MLSPITSLPPVQGLSPGRPGQASVSAGGSSGFKELFDKLGSSSSPKDIFANGLHKELKAIQEKALEGGAFQARELLLYQIKAGEFNLRVELVSKVAESLLGTLRKLQSQP